MVVPIKDLVSPRTFHTGCRLFLCSFGCSAEVVSIPHRRDYHQPDATGCLVGDSWFSVGISTITISLNSVGS